MIGRIAAAICGGALGAGEPFMSKRLHEELMTFAYFSVESGKSQQKDAKEANLRPRKLDHNQKDMPKRALEHRAKKWAPVFRNKRCIFKN
ncbi:MAG: hypothetical protein WCF20_04095 [Methylovirgula sp.]